MCLHLHCVFLVPQLLAASQAQDTSNDTSDAAASIAFTLQQALSGQLSVSGVITALNSGCSLSGKTPTAVAEQLPPDFASATVYCNLVTQQAVDDWQNIAQVSTALLTILITKLEASQLELLCAGEHGLEHHFA